MTKLSCLLLLWVVCEWLCFISDKTPIVTPLNTAARVFVIVSVSWVNVSLGYLCVRRVLYWCFTRAVMMRETFGGLDG